MAAKGTVPLIENIIQKGIFNRNLFSFYLSEGKNDDNIGLKSKIVFGKIDVSDIVS
jgi:hypothetical protein